MNILLISSYDQRGGAAIACLRLAQSLLGRKDVKVRVLVNFKSGESSFVKSVNKTSFHHYIALFKLYAEAFIFSLFAKTKKDRFSFSMARFGNGNIQNHPWVKEADIIHLHWVHHSFLSLSEFKKLQSLGKPVFWTLHDMWAFTGGCHYSGACEGYLNQCGNCPFLKNPSEDDLSNKIWKKKQDAYKKIFFITCSNWLGKLASKSSLLKKFPVNVIPNPIDTDIFKPLEKDVLKEFNLDENKLFVLFGAENISDERKGFSYLTKALMLLKEKYPEFSDKIELLLFGRKPDKHLEEKLSFKINYVGSFSDQKKIAKVYNAASVYVTPSLQDNLPNTIMESLACGTPVVAFKTGGIPDMIDHKINGYLSEYQSAEDLMTGIEWVLSDRGKHDVLSHNAREKVLNNFSNRIVADKHVELYLKAPAAN